jgi:hypothetical protein
MRRDDKEITDRREIQEILESARICRIALCDGDTPYIVPVNYGYHDNALYVHSAPEGRKIDILRRNNAVCFEIERDMRIVPADRACRWAARYTSLVGNGRAEILEDRESKIHGLHVLMRQQSGRDGWTYPEDALERMVVVRISIDSVTGKRSGR